MNLLASFVAVRGVWLKGVEEEAVKVFVAVAQQEVRARVVGLLAEHCVLVNDYDAEVAVVQLVDPAMGLPPPAGAPTLAVVGQADDGRVAKLLKAGYRGCLREGQIQAQLLLALGALVRGGFWAEPQVIEALLDHHKLASFTRREAEIYNLAVFGMSISEMAVALGLPAKTVRVCLSRLLLTLQVKTQKELMIVHFLTCANPAANHT